MCFDTGVATTHVCAVRVYCYVMHAGAIKRRLHHAREPDPPLTADGQPLLDHDVQRKFDQLKQREFLFGLCLLCEGGGETVSLNTRTYSSLEFQTGWEPPSAWAHTHQPTMKHGSYHGFLAQPQRHYTTNSFMHMLAQDTVYQR